MPPPFRKLIEDLCNCNSDLDVLNYILDKLGCPIIPMNGGQLGCDEFKMAFDQVLSSTTGRIGEVIEGLKPVYDLSIPALLYRLKVCYTCEELIDMFNTNPSFVNLIMQLFGTTNANEALEAMKDYFGCGENELEGGSIIPDAKPCFDYVIPSSFPKADYTSTFKERKKYKVASVAEIRAKIEERTWKKYNKFYSSISSDNFMAASPQALASSDNMYACAIPAPEEGGSGSSGTSYVGTKFPFNTVLGLNIDAMKYTCCTYCDLRLYDKALFKQPPKEPDPCEYLMGLAITNAISEYNKLIQAKAEDYKKKFINKCMDAAKLTVSATANDRQHHYTLYYYDQAGNLVQTVPPAGVRDARVMPHRLVTKYRYNMDNQLLAQSSPDGGRSIFIYDELGRLILSQNAKQAPHGFSYFIYDKQSRIIEFGQIKDLGLANNINALYQPTKMGMNNIPMTSFYYQNDNHRMMYCNFEQFMAYNKANAGSEYSYVTRTHYDNINTLTLLPPMNASTGFVPNVWTENTHRRIAATTLDEYDADKNGATYSSALLYSYDLVGNVKKLYSFNGDNAIPDPNERLKTVDYQFDLQSGKATKVYYQKGKPDQYIHRYGYDADNRLTDVHTSFDDKLYQREARYTYYLHGPLARVEMGEHKVQGLDYVYTLQGWLKSVNGSTLAPNTEPGLDGADYAAMWGLNCAVAAPFPTVQGANPAYMGVGKDAVAYSLDYNQNDYSAISGSNGNIAAKLSTKNLYNGNIVSMKLSNKGLENAAMGQPATMGFSYTYDQLHRIVAMDAYKGTANTPTPDYKETVSYDANGNILSYKRNKDNHTTGTNPSMDDLNYKYYYRDIWGGLQVGTPAAHEFPTNQLAQIQDAVPDAAYNLDIDHQPVTTNYQYDATGNLIRDEQEGMDITWNPVGKISSIVIDKAGTTNDKSISFAYDPLGQRITKMVNDASGLKYTYYRRDAQGNLLATNEKTSTSIGDGTPTNVYSLSEYIVYGSARLGVKRPRKCFDYVMGTNFVPSNNNNQIYSDEYFEQAQVTFSASTGCSNATSNNYSEDHYQEYGFNPSYIAGGLTYIPKTKARIISYKSSLTEYEIANHLGNVLATLKDEVWYKKTCTGSGSSLCCLTTREPITLAATDYYPFGMPMPNRTYSLSSSKYRFGFNGQEKDDEVYGEGNLLDYGERIYDSRIGKFLSVDPLTSKFPMLTPYQIASNNPIWLFDLDGLEGVVYFNGSFKKIYAGEVVQGITRLTDVYKRIEKQISNTNVDIHIVIHELHGGPAGFTAPLMKSYKELTDYLSKIHDKPVPSDFKLNDYNAIKKSFEEGREVILIVINDDLDGLGYQSNSKENFSSDELINSAMGASETVLHELIAHAVLNATGKSTNVYDEHEKYHGDYTWNSPSFDKIDPKGKTKASEVKRQILKVGDWLKGKVNEKKKSSNKSGESSSGSKGSGKSNNNSKKPSKQSKPSKRTYGACKKCF